MNTITFGTENTKWQQHGLLQHKIEYNGHPTQYTTIERNNKLIAIGTDRYALLPNEEALRIADLATEQIGLKPFTHPYKQNFEYCQGKQHAIIDHDTRLNAFYAVQTGEIGHDKMFVGLHVYNSIDRSTAFGAGAFSFRTFCSNQVIIQLKTLSATLPSKQTLAYIYEKHSGKKFQEQYFNNIITKLQHVTSKVADVLNYYQTMTITDVNKELIERLQTSKLPANIKPDYIPEKQSQMPLTIPKITQWQLYNDITANIWHNEKTTLQTKQYQYNILHGIIPLQTVK